MSRKPAGRRRIEMKKIENNRARNVTFSKCKKNIFKKASDLATDCGAQIAIIIFSPAGKPFSFGIPSVDSVVDRFLSEYNTPSELPMLARFDACPNQGQQELIQEHNELVDQLEASIKHGDDLRKTKDSFLDLLLSNGEGLNLQGLEKLGEMLSNLKKDLMMTMSSRSSSSSLAMLNFPGFVGPPLQNVSNHPMPISSSLSSGVVDLPTLNVPSAPESPYLLGELIGTPTSLAMPNLLGFVGPSVQKATNHPVPISSSSLFNVPDLYFHVSSASKLPCLRSELIGTTPRGHGGPLASSAPILTHLPGELIGSSNSLVGASPHGRVGQLASSGRHNELLNGSLLRGLASSGLLLDPSMQGMPKCFPGPVLGSSLSNMNLIPCGFDNPVVLGVAEGSNQPVIGSTLQTPLVPDLDGFDNPTVPGVAEGSNQFVMGSTSQTPLVPNLDGFDNPMVPGVAEGSNQSLMGSTSQTPLIPDLDGFDWSCLDGIF